MRFTFDIKTQNTEIYELIKNGPLRNGFDESQWLFLR